MKKAALICLFLLVPIASAQLSQEGAGNVCNQYAGEGETIQVTGPVSCEGSYWLCEFTYFGNKQNVVLAISQQDGAVVPLESDLLPDLVSVRYAEDVGSSYIFRQFITDPSLAIEMRGLNSTTHNYQNILLTLKNDGHITAAAYVRFKDQLAEVRDKATGLAEQVDGLYNRSEEFFSGPDCIMLIDYLDLFNHTISLAQNFSESWGGFINDYNTMATSLEEIYVAAINPSDAQIFGQRLEGLAAGMEEYAEGEEAFKETVLGNLETRFERKETKDRLDEAYGIIKDSTNPQAAEKYNEASKAFASGDYQEARGLINEAVALAGIEPPDDDGDEPVVIVEEAPDYTIYFILIGLLLAGILILTMLKRRGGGEEGEGGGEKDEPAKGKWSWSGGGDTALEKAGL